MTSMKVLTNEEIEQLWEATDNDQERAMVLTMLECGLRLGELANLRTGDVANGELFLTGKAGTRQVPVSTKVTDMLRDIAQGDVIWADTRGEALTLAGVRYRFMKLLKRAGIAGYFLRNGGRVMVLAKIMGFASAMTAAHFWRQPLLREDMPTTSLTDDLNQNDG